MESLGITSKRNDGCDGRPCNVAASFRAVAPATFIEKRTMKKEEGFGVKNVELNSLFLVK